MPSAGRAAPSAAAAAVAVGAAAAGALLPALWPGLPAWTAAAVAAALAAAGTCAASRGAAARVGVTPPPHADRLADDLATLREAFAVLRRQVGSTIARSEDAVVAMAGRMHRVHGTAGALRERIVSAVQRSEALSARSIDQAGAHGEVVASLARHQHVAAQAQAEYQSRVRAVAGRVRALEPLAAQIGEISRYTNLLAINAAVEAAHAGPEGAGFKVVAAEVRRLSQQTASTAREIAGGIASAAAAIDVEVGRAEAMQADDAAGRLGEIAAHLQSMSGTLGDVVPYLGELSTQMDAGMHAVTADILETLGDMQFQDINRQMLEQIDGALDGLGAHCAQWQGVLAGAAEAQQPPPLRAEVDGWAAGYVMHAQRDDHARGVADTRPAAAAAGTVPAFGATEAEAEDEAPAIELF